MAAPFTGTGIVPEPAPVVHDLATRRT